VIKQPKKICYILLSNVKIEIDKRMSGKQRLLFLLYLETKALISLELFLVIQYIFDWHNIKNIVA
jgi:hypothetical protein